MSASQGIGERQADFGEAMRRMIDNLNGQLRVAMPGIVRAFNSSEQTVTVECALRERIVTQNKTIEYISIPTLLDVPIVLPRAGGFAITFPVKPGDECLVIFGDTCIDAWWSNGEVQNPVEYRRHDFSDGFAILGPWSQPKRVENYSTTDLEIKCETADAKISIQPDGDIIIRGKTVTTQQWGV